MLKKYHLTISMIFWILIAAAIMVFLTLSQLLPDFKIHGNLTKLTGKADEVPLELPENGIEYITHTQLVEIEKKIEWFYFVATGYSSNDPRQGTGTKTATGKSVFEGIIAVDPKIIPYGTKIEIKDIGFFVAEDCGSKIKKNRLDIYFDSKAEALKFGRQEVWIRFVNDSPVEIAQITKID